MVFGVGVGLDIASPWQKIDRSASDFVRHYYDSEDEEINEIEYIFLLYSYK